MLPRLNFTRQQWLVTFTFLVVNFCNAMCVSMQAPFYPHEAEKKGCMPSGRIEQHGCKFIVLQSLHVSQSMASSSASSS